MINMPVVEINRRKGESKAEINKTECIKINDATSNMKNLHMNSKFYTLVFSLAILSLTACKSASKSYDSGNYDEAVHLAIKKIQKNPDNGEAKSILQNAYRYAVEDREKRIAQLATNNNEMKWEWIYNEYTQLQLLGDAIQKAPEARRIINPADYTSYINTYKEKAGDAHVEKGLQWLLNDDKLSYRKAYNEFKTALNFKPGNTDVQRKMEDAYNAAILRVAVITPEQHVGYRYTSNAQRQFEGNILRSLQQNINNEFIKFHSTYETSLQPIDQVMEIYVDRMEIGRAYDEKKTREVSNEVVVKEIVHKKDSVTKEYGKVYAKVTTVQRKLKSEGNLIVAIRDMDGLNLWNDNVKGIHNWEASMASYTGDERALSDNDRQLLNQKEPKVPNEDEILDAIYRELNKDLLSKVKSYFNRIN